MRPNLPFVSAKHTLVTYNIMLPLITKTNQGPRCFQTPCGTGSNDSPEATPGRKSSNDSPEGNPRWERQSRFTRGHPRGERQSRLARGHPQAGDTITTHPRPSLSKTGNHDSPEAILGRDRQSRLTRGQPPTGDAVTTQLTPSPG
jgi:hypothetical protein